MRFALFLPGLLLGGLLALAVWHDVRTRRIPNRLVLAGTLAALALQALLPHGAGLFGDPAGALGLLPSLGGWALGLALLLPMYLLGAMGAGDVKLMAMVGAFLGPNGAMASVILTLLAGGVLALVTALFHGVLPTVLANLGTLLRTRGAAAALSGAKLPYAIAISCGTLLQLLAARHQIWGGILS
ncbi:MAG: prepilin peptidase [Pseudomonadota bacterium]